MVDAVPSTPTTHHTLMIVNVSDVAAMEILGARLAAACAGPARIYLSGELGAGKTTLARGFLRARGHSGPVKSPTFTLIEPYEALAPPVYHVDLYRLSDPGELQYLGADECFEAQAQCLVEWPEKATDMLPLPDLRLTLEHLENGRRLRFEAVSERGRAILTRLDTQTKQ